MFLKFSTRTYKDPAERWEVASLCLSLLHKILEEYEPTQTDFQVIYSYGLFYAYACHFSLIFYCSNEIFGLSQGPNNSSGLHPGFYILMHLHQSSLFLRWRESHQSNPAVVFITLSQNLSIGSREYGNGKERPWNDIFREELSKSKNNERLKTRY